MGCSIKKTLEAAVLWGPALSPALSVLYLSSRGSVYKVLPCKLLARLGYTLSLKKHSLLLDMSIEIVGLPIKNGDCP